MATCVCLRIAPSGTPQPLSRSGCGRCMGSIIRLFGGGALLANKHHSQPQELEGRHLRSGRVLAYAPESARYPARWYLSALATIPNKPTIAVPARILAIDFMVNPPNRPILGNIKIEKRRLSSTCLAGPPQKNAQAKPARSPLAAKRGRP